MFTKKKSYLELIKQNKEELLKNKELLDVIEKRVDEKITKITNNGGNR
ncbi:FbpB family small basic protein [Bacillus weihaiensis]|nr:FbpB family small basic protein [Bacillus weihaiensis]